MTGPVRFQHKFLRRTLWGKQQDLCRAVLRSRSTSVKGCHGSGKTYAAAGLVPWWLVHDQEAIALTVAPTLRQVKTFWSEVHAALRECPFRMPEPSTTGMRLDDKNYALGFSSSKGVNAQGFHGKRVLIIADEAVGIGAELWDAIEGIRAAGDVRLLKLCNPTVPQGAPYDDFTRLRAHTECITISAFDTPNCAGVTLEQLLQLPDEELDLAPYPWLTRRRWVREMYYKWGPNNPRFRSRVLGEFPTQADDAVFRLEWIERAAEPYEPEALQAELRPGAFIQVGFDVAGPGTAETVAYARIGAFVLNMRAWAKADPLDDALRFIGELQQAYLGIDIVVVGDTVGVGFHFLRAIARCGFRVHPFVAGGQAVDAVMFANAKAEAYWRLRELMRTNAIHGLEDEDTRAQLSDIRYRELPSGKIEIEHKDEARARCSESPDRAEACIIAFSRIVQGQPQRIQFMQPVVISRY